MKKKTWAVWAIIALAILVSGIGLAVYGVLNSRLGLLLVGMLVTLVGGVAAQAVGTERPE